MESKSKAALPNCFFKQPEAQGGGYVNLMKGGKKSRERNIPVGGPSTFWILFGERSPSAEPHTASEDWD